MGPGGSLIEAAPVPAPALIYLAVRGIIGAIQRHREKVRIRRLVKKI